MDATVNNIDTSDLMLKTNYNTDTTEVEKKIPNVTDFAKFTELGNKIPHISNLATKTGLTTFENKIPSVSNLVKKKKKQIITLKFQKLKINLITIIVTHIDTQEFNELAADVFNARLAQSNLIIKWILMLNC